jgi:hypothetical protein
MSSCSIVVQYELLDKNTTGVHIGQQHYRSSYWTKTLQELILDKNTTGAHIGQKHYRSSYWTKTLQELILDNTTGAHIGHNILLSNIKCYWQLLFHPLRQHVYDAILKDNTFTKLSFYEKRGNVSDHNH